MLYFLFSIFFLVLGFKCGQLYDKLMFMTNKKFVEKTINKIFECEGDNND